LHARIAHGVHQLLPRTAAIELKQLNIAEQPITINHLQIIARNLDQIVVLVALAALCFTALIVTGHRDETQTHMPQSVHACRYYHCEEKRF
jgi:hypothetical protein